MTPVSRSRHPSPARSGTLVVVGTGIGGVAQVTLEAVEHIRRADEVFYSIVDPVTEYWVRELNANARSFAGLYEEGKTRSETYAEMAEMMIAAVRGGRRVCTVFYGHPGVFVEASHVAIRRLRREGYAARMLPAVSADGCLFADLGINPGQHGIQSFEATDFLLFRRRFDPTSGLILWQIGVLGDGDSRRRRRCDPERLQVLARKLLRYYPASHRVVVYSASTFPTHPPRIRRTSLDRLPHVRIHPMEMLFVPGLTQRVPNRTILKWLAERATPTAAAGR
jgi:precorrin-6B methylase 1